MRRLWSTIAVFAVILVFSAASGLAKPVVKDEVLIPKTPDQAMEVRHIVIKGTNQEIGQALGDIGQKWLNIGSPCRIYRGKNTISELMTI